MSRKRPQNTPVLAALPEEQAFAEVVEMIQTARGKALAAVNTELIDLYWRIGEYISRKLETATWGEGVVEALARYIQRTTRTSGDSPGPTSSGCASSSRPIRGMKKSRRW
jgi:hypothetical protein